MMTSDTESKGDISDAPVDTYREATRDHIPALGSINIGTCTCMMKKVGYHAEEMNHSLNHRSSNPRKGIPVEILRNAAIHEYDY